MNRRVVLVGLCLMVASLACLAGPSLAPPKDSTGKDVPLYSQGTQIQATDEDKTALISDLLGAESLRYFTSTDIRVAKDAAATVAHILDGLLPDSGWRLEADWSSIGQSMSSSTWRNGDLRATVILLDNLDSAQISDLRRRYGLSGVEPGVTLVVTHVWDASRLIPTATPTETLTPTLTPRPSSTPVPSPTWTPLPTATLPPSPTVAPDTAPGTILAPGDVWYQGGMEMRLRNPTLLPGCDGILGFEMSIVNGTGGDVVANISGLDFAVSDDKGMRYTQVYWQEGAAQEQCYYYSIDRLQIPAMSSGERKDLAFRVLGKLPAGATRFVVTIHQAGRIRDAVWQVNIPR